MSISYEGLWSLLSQKNITSVQLRQSTGIAPNTMTKLRNNEDVSLSILKKCCNFLNCDFGDIVSYTKSKNNFTPEFYFNINNRRYLGNKFKLLPFIKETVDKNCNNINSIADIFSGTGVVASAFSNKQIITNDLLYCNYVCNLAWFSHQNYDESKIYSIIDYYNNLNIIEENYMTENFSDTYFSYENCSRIGYIRENIELLFSNDEINERERALLITSLIYGMDKIANTCGHYDAYRKNACDNRKINLLLPKVSNENSPNNLCFNEDANVLVKRINPDLIYLDPPYNSRQYSDTYHLLENVARWDKPEVFGVAKKMDRTCIKSLYCSKQAENTFIDLINNIDAEYILLSYNNMAKKGDDRSNARISDQVIYETLNRKGKLSVFEENYKPFTTGKSSIQNNKERLFLCHCNKKNH